MDTSPDKKSANTNNAKFVTGSTMRHILVMTSTASVGLMAIFLVDFADMYFLSLLGEVEVAAAIGYAGSILFFTTSIGIGLSIAATALTSRSIGAGEWERARRTAVNSLLFATVTTLVLSLIIWLFLSDLLKLLGATGRAHELALGYLRIIVPSMPLLALGICSSAILRSVGDAKRSMYVTLAGGMVNAVLDPIFIFALGFGVDGAAIASVCARIVVLIVGLHGVIRVHDLIARPDWEKFIDDILPISKIALPAILTNIATPIGNAYVTAAIAPFGDSPVAGWAIIGRIIPVAFGTIFALSGAVGPILGQNLGAKQYARVRRTLTDALIFTGCYVLIAWGVLALIHTEIAALFGVGGEARELIRFFCLWLVPTFTFLGALFVTNAAFNNLHRPHYSTIFNWARATLGTIPFVYFGGQWFGAVGVIAGNMVGGLIFGTLAVIVCYLLIDKLAVHPEPMKTDEIKLQRRWPLWPFTTPRG